MIGLARDAVAAVVTLVALAAVTRLYNFAAAVRRTEGVMRAVVGGTSPLDATDRELARLLAAWRDEVQAGGPR